MKSLIFVFLFFIAFSAFSAQKPKALASADSVQIALSASQNHFSSEKKLTWKEKFILKKINKKLDKSRHGGADGYYSALGALLIGVGVVLLILIVGAVIALLAKTLWLAILLGALALLIFAGTWFIFA